MAYTLRLDEVRQEWHTTAIAEQLAAAMGAPVAPVSWAEAKAAFDADLAEPPADEVRPADDGADQSGRAIRLRALGIT